MVDTEILIISDDEKSEEKFKYDQTPWNVKRSTTEQRNHNIIDLTKETLEKEDINLRKKSKKLQKPINNELIVDLTSSNQNQIPRVYNHNLIHENLLHDSSQQIYHSEEVKFNRDMHKGSRSFSIPSSINLPTKNFYHPHEFNRPFQYKDNEINYTDKFRDIEMNSSSQHTEEGEKQNALEYLKSLMEGTELTEIKLKKTLEQNDWNVLKAVNSLYEDSNINESKQCSIKGSDIVETSQISKKKKISEEELTAYKKLIPLFKSYSIDITGLLPETLFELLIKGQKESKEKKKDNTKKYSNKFQGTGYSSDFAQKTDWAFINPNMTKIDNLSSLSIMIEEETKNGIIDQWLVNCISFILSCWLSSKITIEEFFKHLDYYEKCLDSVLRLPEASAHLPVLEGFIGLMNSFAEINNDFTKTLEKHEIRVIQKLKQYYLRVTKQSINSDVLEVSVNETQHEKLVGKKRRSSDNEEQTKMSSPEEKADPTRTNNPRVVDIEEPFKIHKFLSDMNATKNLPSKWMKRLMIELCSMPDSLPDSITVVTGRQCSQPNLLKVFLHPESVDCPCYGGCFEFDVFIPHDYPFKPPKVQLITTGGGSVRFNPNLYNCGKVCLSLLGTWSGEKWNPQVSSLSQVFTSILFLIFVDEPYFNEPGYQSQQGTANGIKCSMSYNSNIRYQTLRFAYLEHFIQGKKNPNGLINQFILPKLAQKWNEKGREIAEGWCVQQGEWMKKGINFKLTEKNMRDVFTRINQAVENYDKK